MDQQRTRFGRCWRCRSDARWNSFRLKAKKGMGPLSPKILRVPPRTCTRMPSRTDCVRGSSHEPVTSVSGSALPICNTGQHCICQDSYKHSYTHTHVHAHTYTHARARMHATHPPHLRVHNALGLEAAQGAHAPPAAARVPLGHHAHTARQQHAASSAPASASPALPPAARPRPCALLAASIACWGPPGRAAGAGAAGAARVAPAASAPARARARARARKTRARAAGHRGLCAGAGCTPAARAAVTAARRAQRCCSRGRCGRPPACSRPCPGPPCCRRRRRRCRCPRGACLLHGLRMASASPRVCSRQPPGNLVSLLAFQ